MQSTNEIFQKNLDEIALSLINTFGLKFKQEEAHLSSPLLRWLDFRCRYVDPIPRPVAYSCKFPKVNLPASAASGLASLVEKFKSGEDVNPYQGRGLVLRNDISGSKRHTRTDLLYADWNLLHFHLSNEPIPSGQFFSKPSDYLAFCLVGSNVAAVVDVLPHPDRSGFANTELFETMAKSWPAYIEQFRLKGISGERELSTLDISQMREAGLSTFSQYNGKLYMSPGGGITSAATPLRLNDIHSHLRRNVRALATMIDDPTGQVRTTPRIQQIPAPEFSLNLDSLGLSVRENISQTHFIIKKTEVGGVITWQEEISDALSPQWAIDALSKVS